MVTDELASRAVWEGSDGVLAANLSHDALAIECSTLSHDWVLELSQHATRRGLRYIDAPVTGLPDTAAAGELTLLVGANPEHLSAARPLLGTFCKRTIAEQAGLDLGVVADALATGQAASPQVIRNARRIAEGLHDRDILFTPQLRLKDVEYALSLAGKFSIGSPFGSLAGQIFRQLCALNPQPVNESKVIDIARMQPAEDR
jgi:3-hydroxyisobutyrate dehydrogenase